MEIVALLRRLWDRRALVALAAFVAIGVGFVLAYRPSLPPESRSYQVGIATASIFVDTPNSQVVEVAPEGSETLGARANVLANLMVEGEVKAAIARRAGLRPDRLIAAVGGPQAASLAAGLEPKALFLTASVLNNPDLQQLPIIEVQTQAATPARAAKLANAAVSGLRDYLDSKAVRERVSDGRRLRVSGLGTAQAGLAPRGPGRVTALGAAILVFLTGCGAILIATAVRRGWRQAAAAEHTQLDSGGPALGDPFGDSSFAPIGLQSSAGAMDELPDLWTELPDDALAAPKAGGRRA